MKDPDDCSNSVAVRFRSHQVKADAAIPGKLIVTEQVSGTVVRREQDVHIAVPVEITVRQSASHLGNRESATHFTGNILEASSTLVQEKQRRLCVRHIAPYIADRVVDMAVRSNQIEESVKIQIRKSASEPKRPSRGATLSRRDRDIGVVARLGGAIQPDHLVIKVSDHDPRFSRVVKVTDIYAHAGASLSVRSERQARL